MPMFGIDSSAPVSKKLYDEAHNLVGGKPSFWGRYVNGTSSRQYQYDASENKFLSDNNIPLLFFARQIRELSYAERAKEHARRNMKGVVDALGAQYLVDKRRTIILYLDVETDDDPSHILEEEYYKNWSGEIVAGYGTPAGKIRFKPAVYINHGNGRQSWTNLNAACLKGADCVGVSVAHYVQDGEGDLAPPKPHDQMIWKDSSVKPRWFPPPHPQPDASIPLLVWQYYDNYPRRRMANGKVTGDIDPELVNPDQKIQSIVLSGTIVPPPPAIA